MLNLLSGAADLYPSTDAYIKEGGDVKGDNFAEAGDYSYDPSKAYPSFADWTHVTLYRNGTLVWGTEP